MDALGRSAVVDVADVVGVDVGVGVGVVVSASNERQPGGHYSLESLVGIYLLLEFVDFCPKGVPRGDNLFPFLLSVKEFIFISYNVNT